jgi:hypothetical protein
MIAKRLLRWCKARKYNVIMSLLQKVRDAVSICVSSKLFPINIKRIPLKFHFVGLSNIMGWF